MRPHSIGYRQSAFTGGSSGGFLFISLYDSFCGAQLNPLYWFLPAASLTKTWSIFMGDCDLKGTQYELFGTEECLPIYLFGKCGFLYSLSPNDLNLYCLYLIEPSWRGSGKEISVSQSKVGLRLKLLVPESSCHNPRLSNPPPVLLLGLGVLILLE